MRNLLSYLFYLKPGLPLDLVANNLLHLYVLQWTIEWLINADKFTVKGFNDDGTSERFITVVKSSCLCATGTAAVFQRKTAFETDYKYLELSKIDLIASR